MDYRTSEECITSQNTAASLGRGPRARVRGVNDTERNMQNLIIPFIVSIVTISIGVYTTVRIKYSSSLNELTTNFKNDAITFIQYVALTMTIYFLVDELISDDELTRIAVFKMSFLLIAIFSFFLSKLLQGMSSVVDGVIKNQSKQLDLMSKHLDLIGTVSDLETDENH